MIMIQVRRSMMIIMEILMILFQKVMRVSQMVLLMLFLCHLVQMSMLDKIQPVHPEKEDMSSYPTICLVFKTILQICQTTPVTGSDSLVSLLFYMFSVSFSRFHEYLLQHLNFHFVSGSSFNMFKYSQR